MLRDKLSLRSTKIVDFFILKMKGGILLFELGRIIKKERLKNNLTLKDVSDATNISMSCLSKIENNKSKNISGVFLLRISKFLKIDYNKLLRCRWDIFPVFLNGGTFTYGSK